MATPKPGEIRCPTCHRSTPPAAFCTQCGSAIPTDARARPRGMDRDELQDRIRARRSGGEPYRRGVSDDAPGYQRYEPEPEDERARSARPAADSRRDYFDEQPAAAAARRGDLTRDDEDWGPSAAAAVPPPAGREPAGEPDAVPDARVDHFDDAAHADVGRYAGDAYDPGYDYDEWEEPRERRSGGGAWAIVGFLALGVLALLGGALLANVFNADPGVGQGATPTPSATASVAATPSPTADATDEATPEPTSDSTPTPDEPVEFPDGFVVEAQPCLPGSAGTDGCDSNAATNSGSLWAWVGFQNGTEDDIIGAELIGPEGNTLTQGGIDLADIGCRPSCPGGWTYFPYSNLTPGEYEVRITRNGEPAGTMHFEVG